MRISKGKWKQGRDKSTLPLLHIQLSAHYNQEHPSKNNGKSTRSLGMLARSMRFSMLPLWGHGRIFDWQRLFRQTHAGDIFLPINKGYLFRIAGAIESSVLCQKVPPEQMSKWSVFSAMRHSPCSAFEMNRGIVVGVESGSMRPNQIAHIFHESLWKAATWPTDTLFWNVF